MWKFLGSLVSGFLLLRDIFGYIIPGAVFAALALVKTIPFFHDHPQYIDPFRPLPSWLDIFIGVVALYVVGQLLVAVGYTLYEAFDALKRMAGAKPETLHPKAAEARAKKAAERKQERIDGIRERTYYWYMYPSMFNELDRRNTINILRVGLALALTAGAWFVLQVSIVPASVSLACGIFLLVNGYRGMTHIAEYAKGTVAAAREARQNQVPIFSWTEQPGDDDQGSGDTGETKQEAKGVGR